MLSENYLPNREIKMEPTDSQDDLVSTSDRKNTAGDKEPEAESSDDDWKPYKKSAVKKSQKSKMKTKIKPNKKQGKFHSCEECDFTTDHTGHLKEHKMRKHNQGNKNFKCSDCDRAFFENYELQRHIRRSHTRLKCTLCENAFPNRTELRAHCKESHPKAKRPKVFECKKCNLVCTSERDLEEHNNSKHIVICSICGDQFKTISVLYKHKETNHPEESLSCSICGKTAPTVKALNKHIKRHDKSTQKKATCDECGKTFTSQSSLYHHKRGVHQKESHYQCDECGQKFAFHHSLKLHILHHKGERPFKCHIPSCGKSYLTSNHLKNHIEAKHSAIRRYVCPVCDKRFPYENSLKMHMMLHTNDRQFMCCICSRGFVSKSALRQHEASHTEERLYQCKICQKWYKTAMLLRSHERRHTSDGSRYMCDICGHTFMYKSNLEAHAMVHKDGKQYECKVCQKKFKTYATLYSHAKVHQLDKPFICEHCGKSFKTKECLKAHEIRHSGLKPYSCNLCRNCFPDKGGLSKHLKTVHARRPRFACPACGKTCNRMDNLRVHLKTHNDAGMMAMTPEQLLIPGEVDSNDDLKLPPAPKGRKRSIVQLNMVSDTIHSAAMDKNIVANIQATDDGISVALPQDNANGNGHANGKEYQTLHSATIAPTTVSDITRGDSGSLVHVIPLDTPSNMFPTPLGQVHDIGSAAGSFMYSPPLLLASNQHLQQPQPQPQPIDGSHFSSNYS